MKVGGLTREPLLKSRQIVVKVESLEMEETQTDFSYI